ncbi:golgin subfamily A member 6-like protein 6 [Xyrichtys novacula]|uniref:Golgin subfamily A member 6-like protein 6 n=1 Tax=Xyrichtys novacula TaxID=13765 RepID=A0AAV1GRU1_XYRNO|nr:golgin subfamily A member 6-like protein 6 [Xyrichtys novacula]
MNSNHRETQLLGQDTVQILTSDSQCFNGNLRHASQELKKEIDGNLQDARKAWKHLNEKCQGEIVNLRTQMVVVLSHDNKLEKEVKMYRDELLACKIQAERRIISLEESLRVQKEESAAKFSAMDSHLKENEEMWKQKVRQLEEENEKLRSDSYIGQGEFHGEILRLEERLRLKEESHAIRLSAQEAHFREMITLTEENAASKLKECEERWQTRVRQLENQVEESKGELSECRAKMERASYEEHLHTQSDDMEHQCSWMKQLDENRTHFESVVNSLMESLYIERGGNSAKIAFMESHYEEVSRLQEKVSASKLKECEEKWQTQVKQLEERVKTYERRQSEQRNTPILLGQTQTEVDHCNKRWSEKYQTLDKSYQSLLAEKEENWQRLMRVEKYIKVFVDKNCKKEKKTKWWKRALPIRRRRRGNPRNSSLECTPLLNQSSSTIS